MTAYQSRIRKILRYLATRTQDSIVFLIITATLIGGGSYVYALWTPIDRSSGAAGQTVSATLIQGIIDNINDLNTRVSGILTNADKPISVCRPTINRTMSASSSSAYQQVIFDERKLDTNSFCNISNSRYQPTKAGYYKINVNVGYMAISAFGGHTVYMLIAKNDTTTEVNTYTLHNYTSSYVNTLLASTIVYLNGTTDYITVKAFTNNTNGATTILNGDNTHFEAEFLRP